MTNEHPNLTIDNSITSPVGRDLGHLPYTALHFTHPTVAEELTVLLSNVPARAAP